MLPQGGESPSGQDPQARLHRAGDRFLTDLPDRTTWHSFSFGPHYDPGNVGFEALIAHNDDRLRPGGGYPPHPHSDLEIVTWVLEGALEHSDAAGNTWTLAPGTAQATSAGSGIVHAEIASPDVPRTRFVQTWVRPDTTGSVPRHARTEPGVELAGDWVPVASGRHPDAALRIGTRAATLWALRSQAAALSLPGHRAAHLFVATGGVSLGTLDAHPGDALRLPGGDSGAPGATEIHTSPDTELMLWTFD